jgi:hypothetical protein
MTFAPRPLRHRRAVRRLTTNLRLSATILHMISTNSLAAFTQDVARAAGIGQVKPVRAAGGQQGGAEPAPRVLQAVPPAPSTPLPRGSLLDLRV